MQVTGVLEATYWLGFNVSGGLYEPFELLTSLEAFGDTAPPSQQHWGPQHGGWGMTVLSREIEGSNPRCRKFTLGLKQRGYGGDSDRGTYQTPQ